jgi:asparagine synthase (glutamine-hydrolysing)
MCGITGEVNFRAAVDLHVIQRMTHALVHRGPDDEGVYCEGRVGLGHRRLSIIDLSPGGHQPMWTGDRSMAIVFNGEVYNYREIRPDLEARGYRFVGSSDTEVVLNAIHCWGMDAALSRFIGMFAFAVWDTRARLLVLARDRLGIKPLYYQKTPERILFGSELKALYAHPMFRRRLANRGLGQFFCFGYTLGETTIFEDTHKVPAGHYLQIFENGETTLKRYWSLEGVERGSFGGSMENAIEHLTSLCESAFGYRLVSDVPVGVFLSGGIDSTFLAAILKKRLAADLEYITVGFSEVAYNEAPKAAQVASDLGLRHTVKVLDAVEARDALFRFVEIWDEPFGDMSGIPTSILCRLARQQVKVALSADGGDELFCGYESYPSYEARYRHLQRYPLPLRQALSSLLNRLPYRPLISAWLSHQQEVRWNPQTSARYEKALELLTVGGGRDLIRTMNEKGWTSRSVRQLLNCDPGDITGGTSFGIEPGAAGRSAIFDYMMRVDLGTFLGEDILTKVDRASMAVSLECRDPFLDHRLVEFAFSLPLDYIYRDGMHKRILKQVLKPWISPLVLSAPKRGFSIPLYDWMRGVWRPVVEEHLSSERVRRVGVLNDRVVGRELDMFYRYAGGRAEKIMLMLNFQLWAERWLQG